MEFEVSPSVIDEYKPGASVRILRTAATTSSPHLVRACPLGPRSLRVRV